MQPSVRLTLSEGCLIRWQQCSPPPAPFGNAATSTCQAVWMQSARTSAYTATGPWRPDRSFPKGSSPCRCCDSQPRFSHPARLCAWLLMVAPRRRKFRSPSLLVAPALLSTSCLPQFWLVKPLRLALPTADSPAPCSHGGKGWSGSRWPQLKCTCAQLKRHHCRCA